MAATNSSGIQYMVDPKRDTPFISPVVCYNPTSTSTGALWQSQSILEFSFPRFILQLLLIVILSRLVGLILRPLHQPRYIANLIGGIIVGPTVLGRVASIAENLFPLASVIVLENMAYLGLIYFTFITGVEIDLTAARRTGHSAAFAFACIAAPFLIGAISAIALQSTLNLGSSSNLASFIVFLGVILSVTSFSVLVPTLANLKLLNSTVGTTALSAAIHVDSFAWVLLALAITLAQNDGDPAITFWTMLSGVAFYTSVYLLVRPAARWLSSRTPEGGAVHDFAASVMLVGVMVASLAADAIGIHAVLGAFVYGFVIPSDSPVAAALIERLEDFVEGLLLPLFFAISGIKTNLPSVRDPLAASFLILVVVASSVAKIAGCLAVANFRRIPLRDGLVIGLLMNTKGVIELVLLNIGRDQQLLSEASFSVLVCTTALITAFVSPVLTLILRPHRRQGSFERRTVQSGRPESEMRVVVCVHGSRHVPAMLGLLELMSPSKRQPISVMALHLIELSSRPSSMLIIHSTTAGQEAAGAEQPSATATISRAFVSYAGDTAGLSARIRAAVSPYPTMHQDVSSIADDFCASLVVLPFHKHRTVDGGMEAVNPSLHSLNQSVLASAPCSVAILIDRGLPAPSGISGPHRAAFLFLGGPDDREALALASRIVTHRRFFITVIRLLRQPSVRSADSSADNDCITEFRLQHVSNDSVFYVEAEANTAEDTMAALRSLIDEAHDLLIVGKRSGAGTPLTAGLNDWIDCPELGPIGDLLATPDFGGGVSVLIVQQYSQSGTSQPSLGKRTMASSRGRFAGPLQKNHRHDRA